MDEAILPAKITEEIVQKMARDAYGRFISPEIPELPAVLPKRLLEVLARVYDRYSDDNSNPRSLDQQLGLGLRAAKKHNCFVPWEFCFFDAAVSGTHPHRRGYQAVKESRVRMIGASDSFDSANPNSDLMVSLFAMVAEQESKTKKDRVERGMHDAFKQKKPLYKPGFGYRLQPELDANGSFIFNAKGKPVQQIVIVEKEAEQVRRVFKMFADQGKSLRQIAKVFNAEKVGGKTSWNEKSIDNILRRSMYIGKEV